MKKLLLTLLGALLALPAMALNFEYTYEGQTLSYIVIDEDAKTVRVRSKGGLNLSGNLIIPSTVKNEGVSYTVTEIDSYAFDNFKSLTSVTIPNSVTSIGKSAFSGCSGLTSVTIGNSVTEIGESAFSRCTGLTSVTIPNSVTKIGVYAFSECTGLTSVTIPNSVTKIGAYAFSGCTGLTSITIPNSVTEIGSSAFYGCIGLTSVDIPNSVTEIGNYTFSGCTGLTSVVIPNSVTGIGDWAFRGCSGLTSVIIPNSVTSIGDCAFASCTGLTSFTIPNSVTEIGYQVFTYCSSLTSITIPNSVTIIGNRAFANCTSLISVTLPNSVTSIGGYVFDGCTGLISVIIGNSVKSIGEGVFKGCTSLIKSAYPNTLRRPFEYGISMAYNPEDAIIEDGLIYGSEMKEIQFAMSSLDGEIAISEMVESIKESAFRDCIRLTSVTIPSSVTKIGWGAFYGCTNLKGVIVGNVSNCTYESDVFGGCNIVKAAYPSSVSNLFRSAKSVKYSFEYDSSVSRVIDGVIYSRDKSELQFVLPDVTTFRISDNIVSIAEYAFKGCNMLESVYCVNPTPAEAPESLFEAEVYEKGTLYVPVGSENSYQKTRPWSFFDNIRTYNPNATLAIMPETIELNVGNTAQLQAVKDGFSDEASVTWSSSDENVATVDTNGIVTAIAEGTATITAYCESMTATCTVTVNELDGINAVEAKAAEAAAVYDMRGVKVGESTEGLPKGIYIVREGSTTRKIAI